MAKFLNVLFVLILGLAVGAGGWGATQNGGSWVYAVIGVGGGLVVIIGLRTLWRLVQEAHLEIAAPLRLLGVGLVLLQVFERFATHTYLPVLASALTMLGALWLLVNLDKSLRV